MQENDGLNFVSAKNKEKGMKIAQDIIPILDPYNLDEIIATLVFLNDYYWNKNKSEKQDEGWRPLEL